MNIITAAKRETQARTALFADYTDDNVSDYTEAAIAYNDSTRSTLNLLSLLISLASVATAAYVFLTHSATLALALAGLATVYAINAYTKRRHCARANIAHIRGTDTVAREIAIRTRDRNGH
ncbi:hypothetical protein [Rhodococcus sp. H29-C3]|uniref:hypothetical protein n=1 Tax=Rhodococcus sp. H29-C3 TaxID=3046307 RepID=UPI0024BAF50E|nr:hypothetical protein [Rhodococcus sp. H29-C3]MDJ0363340.1 hypothetical protein [Rhodococcus sp. H29-C3]